ncbi:MAG: LD-carboxypeptidase [Chloroflexota bacterium]
MKLIKQFLRQFVKINDLYCKTRRLPNKKETIVIKPKRLREGQTVGIVAPASPCNEDRQIRFALETIASLGFKIKEGKNLYRRHGYFAGTDLERAEDINDMFADDEVDAIITLRGGYGSSRILPFLDLDLIRNNPKILIGFSDITALLNGIHRRTGLVTFHGPDAEMRYTKYTLAEYEKVLMRADSPIVLGAAPPFESSKGVVEYKNRFDPIVPGKATGQLIGGNLTLITDLLGTTYEPDFQGKILFLENCGLTTDEIDRSLSHLWLAGKLQQVNGIVFGQFADISYLSNWAKRFTLAEVLAERCKDLNIPSIAGLMFGHIDDMTTIPLGCEAELDVDAGTLTLLENAVI